MEQKIGAADRGLSFYKMGGEPGDGDAGLLITVLSFRRQRQKNLCEFKALLLYRTKFQNSLQRYKEKPCLKTPKKQTNKQK